MIDEGVKEAFNRQEFIKRCKVFMHDNGFHNLEAIATDTEDRNQFRALELLCNYAFGKPKQGIELTGEDGESIKVTLEGSLEEWGK